MGDAGKGLYIPAETADEIIADLIPRADVVACNSWELQKLTGTDARDPVSAMKAARLLGKTTLVSSVQRGAEIGAVLADKKEAWLAAHAKAERSPNGTGDLLTALYTPPRSWRGRPSRTAWPAPIGGVAETVTAANVWNAPELPIVAMGARIKQTSPTVRIESSGWRKMSDITGLCPDRFARVREAFEANFADGGELGARFAFAIDGEIVVDLMGGHADRKREVAFGPDTLTALFSTTKAVAALMVARLVDEGRLAYDQRVADVWPEFAQAGKGDVTVEQALSHQAGLSGFPDETDPPSGSTGTPPAPSWPPWPRCSRSARPAAITPSPSATSPARSSAGSTAGRWARRCARTSRSPSAWTCGSACPTASMVASPS
jgi:hypothetical protein